MGVRIFIVENFDEKRVTPRQARQIAKRTGRWIDVPELDYDAIDRAPTTTDAFYLLQPHIPKGYHPADNQEG